MKEDFNKFIYIFEKNKTLIKDNSYKTIEAFMSLFKNPLFTKLNSDNDLDFIFNDKIIYKFNEENNILENNEKEYLILIYISLKENIPKSFYEKLLIALIDNFNPTKIFLNLKVFKKYLKFILKKINIKDPIETINNNINNNKDLEINNINKKKIILFLYYYYFYNNIEISNIDNGDNLDVNKINFDYIEVIFELNKILNLYLSKESDYISCQNYFNYLFNKHFFTIKKISQEKNNNLFSKLLNTFLQLLKKYELSENKNNSSIYENFLYIISFLLCPTNDEDAKLINNLINSDNSNENKEIIDKVKKNILISNNSILHQISINLLNKNEKKLNEDFMKKYISIYDVLDGFNCHLFKSLEPEFKSILLFINNNSKIENINDYMDLFILLNRKVFNHENSRIHKFFIKTICRMENLNSEIFNTYLFNDFLENINSSMLYSENEKHIYHNKVGLLINSFLIKYLNINKKYLFDFIHGLSIYVNNRKIIPYLINTIDTILTNNNNNLEENNFENIINDVYNIIEKLCNGNTSQYQKFKNYDTMGKILLNLIPYENIFLNEKNKNENLVVLIKIYYLLFEYLLNFNKDVLSIEYLNLSDIEIFDKENIIYKSILSLLELFKKYLTITDDYNQFLNSNVFVKNIPHDNLNLLFFSVNNSNQVLNSFFISNEKKIFSDYLNEEQKKEYLSQFNTILSVQKIFNNNNIKENLNYIKDIFDNIFSSLKNFSESNNNINISKELFDQYEYLLFNYIYTYHTGFNDILINNIQFTLNNNSNNSNIFFYRLLFIKMYLFQYLTCIHFQIYDAKNKSIILDNKTLKNNLISILNYLLNNESNINNNNKLIFIKCFILCLIALKTVNYDELFKIFEKIENKDNSNSFSVLNLDFFYNYFDILSENDLFYAIKFLIYILILKN